VGKIEIEPGPVSTMKNKFFTALSAALLLLPNPRGMAAEKSDPSAELKDLVEKIQTKLKEGKKSDKDLADELKEFDTLLLKHKDEKTDEVARILLMKAQLYFEVFDNTEKGVELVKQMKRDFADTESGKSADQILESIQRQEQVKKTQRTLVAGAKFPDFSEKDVAGKPLSVANYQGKVVLVDFWATWCVPCREEMPSMERLYRRYGDRGLTILAVSVDRGGPATVAAFVKMLRLTYRIGLDPRMEVAEQYRVRALPSSFLVDRQGNVAGIAVGPRDWDSRAARAVVETLLK